MKEGKASRTADIAAVFRASHSRLPENERIIYDPFAKHFLTGSYRILHALCRSRFLLNLLGMYAEKAGPGSYGWTIARHRYIDDYLIDCINGGIEQLVILGAGYDTRAYRLNEIKGTVKVFEVDHPATQKEKKENIEKLLGSIPDHVVYVSVNFEKEALDKKLSESGYKNSLKTLFVWEAVTMYITPQAVDATLSCVAENTGEGSSIIFDYVYKSVVDGTSKLLGAERFRKGAKVRGDSLLFGIEEGSVEKFLSERGFYKVSTVDGTFLKSKYFKGDHEKYGIAPFIGYVHATICGNPKLI